MAQRRLVLGPAHPPQPHGSLSVGDIPDVPSRADADHDELREAFAAIRRRLAVPGDFPAEVLAEAERAAQSEPPAWIDMTGLPFITIDPPGSMDLDQALHLQRHDQGYLVRYAIADVPSFVAPGGAIDQEARRRGETIYLPDRAAPLHPPRLCEGAASLLPGQDRPAFVWQITLDAHGLPVDVDLRRATIRSAARLDYGSVQHDLDQGTADPMLLLLAEIGLLRIEQEISRGGASLPKPEQEVITTETGYQVRFRPPAPVEDWNAHISLLTGMSAADIMLRGGIGILRTMPAPDTTRMDRFRRQATALGVHWPEGQTYGAFLRHLDHSDPHHVALMHAATSLFRGAGYTPFDGTLPTHTEHAALAAPYAHVTAPLRRLVDRFGLVVCAALCAGEDVPEWARHALPQLPEVMSASGRLSGAVERACTDAVEAAVLAPMVGRSWDAVVVESRGDEGCTVQITDPAVVARCPQQAAPGSRVQVTLTGVDVLEGRSSFVISDSSRSGDQDGTAGKDGASDVH
ncbi:Ribonuclease R [Austwickia sp. TVS 96-490-7B]|uniref:RNB domain-containing ribonuclease n=1 Tax=Austwickia sp. TVS 96-490-7B TaxID=2830843 RepID=UPI001C59C05C|nr:RNB domain-containing ribonuclease [Austwickia sp. TVS 96-490-7B]MBW3086428.1 Ribonuclease R [Austwickia sp. TVS 96-490-7B]